MTQTSFSADLSKFGVAVDKRLTRLIRQTALGTLKDLQEHNPVLTGWSRGSWQISINKNAGGVYSYYRGSWVSGTSPKGNRPNPRLGQVMSIPEQKEHLSALKWSDRIIFTNNVPYIGYVEEKTGFIQAVIGRARTSLYTIAGELSK